MAPRLFNGRRRYIPGAHTDAANPKLSASVKTSRNNTFLTFCIDLLSSNQDY